MLIAHPFFCWAFFLVLGVEAVGAKNPFTILIVGLALPGMSQTYWRTQFKGKDSAEKADLVSFFVGASAAVTYIVYAIIKLFFS